MRFLTACSVLVTMSASAGPVEITSSPPTLDRWMYPFNPTPGSRSTASIFGAIGVPGFDNIDGQFLVAFDTSDVQIGLQPAQYRVVSARLTVVVANDMLFEFDPTHDAVETYFDPNDPSYLMDLDAGRPIELFPVGYRNGFTTTTFLEDSEFGGVPTVPPAQGARNAFPANLSAAGATDVSNHVDERFEPRVISIGQCVGVAPGALVPAGTVVVFDIDTCVDGMALYLGEALSLGKLDLLVTGKHATVIGGQTGFPILATKENGLFGSPTLELTVVVDDDADLNGDGVKDVFDFLEFQNLFAVGDPLADYSNDCVLDLFDFLAYQNAFLK